MKQYDAIVIGSGQAGTPLAKKLAEADKKTLIVEKRWIGGTCINDGCTPTKAMISSARAAYLANGERLGVSTTGSWKMADIKARKDEIVARFRGGSQKGLEQTQGLDLVFGTAVFSGEKTITVKFETGEEESFSADWIFINAGAKAFIPDIPGLEDVDFLTSTSILDLESVPSHLLVIGGNYIGLEFGQMFRRFGSEVTILERSERILPREDEDVATELTGILADEAINILTHTEAKQFEMTPEGTIRVALSGNSGETELHCSHVLVAAGRVPQTEGLRLDLTGVLVDEKGYIKVDDRLQTNVPGIFALGDVKGGPAFTHIAYNDYTIVYRNLIEGQSLSIKDRLVPYCMFTDPQLGRVGLSETEARERGLTIDVAVLPMSKVARGIETGETKGMMKVVIDVKTRKILGAAILAVEGGEVMSVLQMAMQGGLTCDQLRYGVFAHPTFSESINNLFMQIK